jgi:hypothetical protein
MHQRGVDLLCNLMDAESHVEALTEQEVRALLTEAIAVLGALIERDSEDKARGSRKSLPAQRGNRAAPVSKSGP